MTTVKLFNQLSNLVKLFLVSSCILFTLNAHAIGLGKPNLYSNLGEKLNLEIELENVDNLDINQLAVQIASDNDYELANIEKTYILRKLDCKVIELSDKRKLIAIKSHEHIEDPSLEILLHLKWPQGGMIKDYTIFLSPPALNANHKLISQAEVDNATGRLAKKIKQQSKFAAHHQKIKPKPKAVPDVVENMHSQDKPTKPKTIESTVAMSPEAKLVVSSSNENFENPISKTTDTEVTLAGSENEKTLADSNDGLPKKNKPIAETDFEKTDEINYINHQKSSVELYIFIILIILIAGFGFKYKHKVADIVQIIRNATGKTKPKPKDPASDEDLSDIKTAALSLQHNLEQQNKILAEIEDNSNDEQSVDELETKLELVENYYKAGEHAQALLVSDEIRTSGNKDIIARLEKIESKQLDS